MPWVNISTLDEDKQHLLAIISLRMPNAAFSCLHWQVPSELCQLIHTSCWVMLLATVIFFSKMSCYSFWHLQFYIWKHRQCSLKVIEFYQVYCFPPSALAEVVIITCYCSTIVRGLRVMKYSWAQPVYIKARFEQLKITQSFLPSWKHTVGVLLKCIKPMHWNNSQVSPF